MILAYALVGGSEPHVTGPACIDCTLDHALGIRLTLDVDAIHVHDNRFEVGLGSRPDDLGFNVYCNTRYKEMEVV